MSRDITQLHPRLQVKLTELKELCEAQGIKIKYTECLRTVEEQDTLYAQGRTKPGNIVTNAKGSTYSSQHQWGHAADFCIDMDVDGDGSKSDDAFNNSTGLFDRVGAIAKTIGLGWGGDWTNPKDRPHLYLPDWGSTTTKLKQLYGTPEKFRATWVQGEATTHTTTQQSAGYSLKQFVRDVQAATGSKVDGIAGSETIGNTVTVSISKNRNHAVVTPLERYLKMLGYYSGAVEADSGKKPCFGTGMDTAVRTYQKDHGCTRDGEITAKMKTWKKLLGMA